MSRQQKIVAVSNGVEVLQCGHFGQRRTPGKMYFDRIRVCHECPAAFSRKEISQRRRERIRQGGLCPRCCKSNDNKPFTYCRVCTSKRRHRFMREAVVQQ